MVRALCVTIEGVYNARAIWCGLRKRLRPLLMGWLARSGVVLIAPYEQNGGGAARLVETRPIRLTENRTTYIILRHRSACVTLRGVAAEQQQCGEEMAAEEGEKKRNVISSTDLTKWRLKNERGRQTWWYDVSGDFERESNFAELHSLGLDTVQ